MEMSLKLRRCCEYVFMFKCFDPSGNKTIPWETVAGCLMLISSKKTWGKLPSHPLFCSFLLLWWFSVVCTGASCTGAEPELPPAGGGLASELNPISLPSGSFVRPPLPPHPLPDLRCDVGASRLPCRWLPHPAETPVRCPSPYVDLRGSVSPAAAAVAWYKYLTPE